MTGGRGTRLLAGLGLVSVVTVTLAEGGFALVLREGVSTRDEPSAIEAALARAARAVATPAKRLSAPPEASSASSLAAARVHWASHCASCHGDDGSGATPMGRLLYPRPPDMRAPETQGLSDGELYFVIKNGVRLTGMPGWGDPGDADAESWALVAFIRTLPRLTADELAEIRHNTPRTPQEREEELDEQRFLQGAPTTDPPHKEHHP